MARAGHLAWAHKGFAKAAVLAILNERFGECLLFGLSHRATLRVHNGPEVDQADGFLGMC